MMQKSGGAPGVLGCDDVHVAENTQGPQHDVLEVADGVATT
ncbi:MAG: hypothetical protein ACRD26_00100 [Vicinamibacterales bacterium]